MSDAAREDPTRAGPLAVLRRQPRLAAYLLARLTGQIGTHMFGVVIGWHVYELTGDVFALGIVGLVRFVPAIAMFPVAGYAADHYPRRAVYVWATLAQVASALVILADALLTDARVAVIYAALLLFGTGRAFGNTAGRSILGSVTDRPYLPSAVALNSVGARAAALVGPVLGGVLIVVLGAWVYAAVALLYAGGLLALIRVGPIPLTEARRGVSLAVLTAGTRYVWQQRPILGTISLDLAAVVGGTVIGILPVFAKDVLGVGPEGLGLLRSMPSLGAMVMALLLSRSLPGRSVGLLLFGSLAVHGVAIVAFGLSTAFWLSLAALAVYGATDMVGVWIRQTIIQFGTPNAMLGQVSAVETATSNGSEELGNFRSGLVAAALGAPAAVLVGGAMTVAIAGLGWLAFPELRRMSTLGS